MNALRRLCAASCAFCTTLGAFGGIGHAATPADVAPDSHGYQFALRVQPPLLQLSSPYGVHLGGAAVGVIAPNDLWVEASYGLLAGLQGFGEQATALAGYTFGRAPAPHTWGFSVPAYAGYRYMSRPNWSASDGNSFHEDMHMLGLGARAVWTRRYDTNAIEIGLDAGAFVPFSWREPQSAYYSEDKTTFVAQAFLFVGWVVGASASNGR